MTGEQRSRDEVLAEQSRKWNEWAKNATTDTVPDRFVGEPLPGGGIADRPMWFHEGSQLRDYPPDPD